MPHFLLACLALLFAPALLPAEEGGAATLSSRSSKLEYLLVHPMHRIRAQSVAARFTATLAADGTWAGFHGEVPVASFDSANANRDSHALEVVEGPLFPKAEFRAAWVSNDAGGLRAGGTLRFHGIERPFSVQGSWKETPNDSVLTGSFRILLSDFKVPRPALLFVPVQDGLAFTYEIHFPARAGWPGNGK